MGKFAERKRAAAVIIEAVYGDGIEIGHFLRFGNFEGNTVLNLNFAVCFLLEPKGYVQNIRRHSLLLILTLPIFGLWGDEDNG